MKISQNLMFSNQYARGSVIARLKLSEKLNEKIFNNVLPLFEKKNRCTINSLYSRFMEVLPENKQILFIPYPDKVSAPNEGEVSIIEKDGKIDCYSIGITTRKKHKKQKMSVRYLPSFMHESTHLLDYLLNPKYILNEKKMYDKNIYDKEYFNIFEDLFYNVDDIGLRGLLCKDEILKKAEEGARNALKTVPFDEKIIFLRYMKYSMISEQNAFNQDYKYTRLLGSLRNFKLDKEEHNWNDYLHFSEKIDIVNKLIMEAINAERLKNKAMIA